MKVAIPLALLLSVQTAAAQSTAPPPPDSHIDTVDVEAPRTPLEQGIHDFVNSYVQPSFFSGKITTWRTKICPETQGLVPELALSVTKRLREVAAQVGAPVDTTPGCKPNVLVYFTRQPQALLDQLVQRNEDMLGYHEVSQTKELATIRHPIQAWYATATRDDNGNVGLDSASTPCNACDLPGQSNRIHVRGWRAGLDGLHAELGRVTIIGDLGKLDEYETGTLADYVAMLALSQVQAFETCQEMPTITNLLVPGCSEERKTRSLGEIDLVYLRALYRTNPDLEFQHQKIAISHQMEDTLKGK